MPGAPSVHGPHPVNLMAESFISHALWTASFTHAFCCVNPAPLQQTGMLPGSGHRVLVATKSVSWRPPLTFAFTRTSSTSAEPFAQPVARKSAVARSARKLLVMATR